MEAVSQAESLTEARSNDRVDQIIQAALRCFDRWGVTRTRMGDIADEVGIPRPHLYRHFPSKDALIAEVVLREIRLRSERIAGELRLEGPARRVLVKVLVNVIENSRDDYYTKLLLRSDVVSTTARLVAQTDAVIDAVAQFWRPVLDYARRRGELREDVEMTTVVRWMSFLLFSYLALPEWAGSTRQLRDQLEAFVVPALLEPA